MAPDQEADQLTRRREKRAFVEEAVVDSRRAEDAGHRYSRLIGLNRRGPISSSGDLVVVQDGDGLDKVAGLAWAAAELAQEFAWSPERGVHTVGLLMGTELAASLVRGDHDVRMGTLIMP